MSTHKYGPSGYLIDAFIEHIKGMTREDWDKFYSLTDDLAPAERLAQSNCRHYIEMKAHNSDWRLAGSSNVECMRAVDAAKKYYIGYTKEVIAARLQNAGSAAHAAAAEIHGADVLRERGIPFYFLPLFGFDNYINLQKKERNV